MKLLALVLLLATPAFADGPSAQEIVAKSDRVRNPGEPFRLTNRLTEFREGVVRDEMTLIVFSKEDSASRQFRSLVRYMDPPRDNGKMVLLNGTKMWFFDPASKASVRISPQQRLIGQASEGDVVTVNLAEDYKAKLLGTETIQDADRKQRTTWHLELTPSREDAIYARIEYWVEQSNFWPVKGKFFADSGRPLKIAYYHRFEKQLGADRPGEVIIIDAVNSKLVTTMRYSDLRSVEIPESWFQRDYLPHVRVEP
jgi:hypothetical protein